MMVELHDANDGLRVMVNLDDISRIEESSDGSMVYLKTVADDFDGKKHPVMIVVSETYDQIRALMWKFGKL